MFLPGLAKETADPSWWPSDVENDDGCLEIASRSEDRLGFLPPGRLLWEGHVTANGIIEAFRTPVDAYLACFGGWKALLEEVYGAPLPDPVVCQLTELNQLWG